MTVCAAARNLVAGGAPTLLRLGPWLHGALGMGFVRMRAGGCGPYAHACGALGADGSGPYADECGPYTHAQRALYAHVHGALGTCGHGA